MIRIWNCFTGISTGLTVAVLQEAIVAIEALAKGGCRIRYSIGDTAAQVDVREAIQDVIKILKEN